jgi:hypothetical protein
VKRESKYPALKIEMNERKKVAVLKKYYQKGMKNIKDQTKKLREKQTSEIFMLKHPDHRMA